MVQSSHFDGKMPLWYHFDCFFPKFSRGVKAAADIGGIDALRWEDAQHIKQALGINEGELVRCLQ